MTAWENPYEAPGVYSPVAIVRSELVSRRTLIPASLICITGITAAGAAFGTFLFPIIGTLFGFALALITSSPICVIVMTLVRLTHGPAIRKSTITGLAAFCGCASGFISVLCLGGLDPDALVPGVFAGCFGSTGGAVSVWCWLKAK